MYEGACNNLYLRHMKLSGFTFVRNAIAYDYPIVESILSLLPLVDEYIVVVGDCADGTMEAIRGIADERIRIVRTVWDESLRANGEILAQQTNIALAECTGDWCLYLQADEVLHEQDLESYRQALHKAHQRRDVEALLQQWRHFYATYDWLGAGRQWYRREIRAVRNVPGVVSWGDAQGFRKREGAHVRKLRAMPTDVTVYHYGWVKPPEVQQRKQQTFNRYWHDDQWITEHVGNALEFDYSHCHHLKRFVGSHPKVMAGRVSASSKWASYFDPSRLRRASVRDRMLDGIESLTGIRMFEYRNYQLVR